jgi:predicted secreted protein
MKKLIIGGFILASCLISAFAGDAAVFVDTGFSSDGSVYVFGEYGKTDKSFQGWAEIYTVDIAKNDFVKGGIFRTRPTAVTAGKAGREVYDALAAKSWFSTRQYGCKPASGDQILYICGDENKTGTDEIVFKDFTGSSIGNQASYHIRLVQSVNGTGPDARSSFYIVMEKQNSDGTVLSTRKIGSPDVVRKGVTGYKIEKICCSGDGTGIVFIIEKTMEDATGVLVRYMAEAVKTDASSAK